MGLYAKWVGGDATPKINVHAFGAILCELADGAVTKAQVVSAFNLDSTDESELDAIIAKYQALSTEVAKARFLVKLENVMILSEAEIYPESKAKTELGF